MFSSTSSSRPPSSDNDMPSLLTAALPASIQSRIPKIPKIPSIRRTVNIQAALFRSESSTTVVSGSSSLPPSLSSSPSSSSPSSSRPSTSYMESPPSILPDRPALDRAQAAAVLLADQVDKKVPGQRAASKAWSSSTSTSTSTSSTINHTSGQTADLSLVLATGHAKGRPEAGVPPSHVNWKYGQNGLRTLEQAMREAGDPDRLPELERQIYIESVTYLLRGLPGDLHDGELHQLRQAAPDLMVLGGEPHSSSSLSSSSPSSSLAHHQALLSAQSTQLAICSSTAAADRGAGMRYQKSLPHVLTHWLITRIYALVVALIPVAMQLTRWAVEVDRKYHVQRAAVAWGTAAFLALYRYAVEVFVAVCSMGDGRVGRAVDEGAAFLASGVAAGFREAVYDVAQGKT